MLYELHFVWYLGFEKWNRKLRMIKMTRLLLQMYLSVATFCKLYIIQQNERNFTFKHTNVLIIVVAHWEAAGLMSCCEFPEFIKLLRPVALPVRSHCRAVS